MNVASVASHATSSAAPPPANISTAMADAFNNPASTLNQSDFLKLLVAQIQYQDPMNPQSDTQMAAQLAQFTALQQASQSSSSLAMMQANGLVGSTVTVQVDSQTSASGVVSGVVLSNGTPEITIKGTNYNLSQITSVAPTVVSATPTPTTVPTPTTAAPQTAATNP